MEESRTPLTRLATVDSSFGTAGPCYPSLLPFAQDTSCPTRCSETICSLEGSKPFCLWPHPHSETRKPGHRMRSSETSQSCDRPDGELVLWWPLASSSGCWDWPQGREDGWGGRNWQAGRREGGEPLTAEQMLVIL